MMRGALDDFDTYKLSLLHLPPRMSTIFLGWSHSSVREILHRPIYRGDVLWNKTKKGDPRGVKPQRPRPEHEWIRVPAPEL